MLKLINFYRIWCFTCPQITCNNIWSFNNCEDNKFVSYSFDFLIYFFSIFIFFNFSFFLLYIILLYRPADTPNKGPNTPYLQTAVVLTVLDSLPVNSTYLFRPPYFGPNKVIIFIIFIFLVILFIGLSFLFILCPGHLDWEWYFVW